MHREKFHEVIEQAATELEEIETVREIAIKSAREIIRTSRKIIHEVHLEKDVSEDFKKLKEAMMNVRTLCEKIDKNKILPVLEDAYQEYAEAYLFLAIVREEDIPSHRELGIT
ncbi:MAG: translin family protein, partial [Thermoplasmata archaeon]